MKRLSLSLLAFAVLAASGAPAGPKHGKKWIVGMSQCNLGEPWRVQMNADIKAIRN